MRRFSSAAVLLVVCWLAHAPAGSEEIRNTVDRRPPGAALGGEVVFTWRRPLDGSAGHAVIALFGEQGGRVLRTAWGATGEGGLKLATLDQQSFERLHAAAEGSLTVQVTREQLDEVAALLHDGIAKHGALPPAQACDNVVYALVPRLGLKGPYRGGFAAADPFGTFRDLTRINRPTKSG
jgi:hypothetical protein